MKPDGNHHTPIHFTENPRYVFAWLIEGYIYYTSWLSNHVISCNMCWKLQNIVSNLISKTWVLNIVFSLFKGSSPQTPITMHLWHALLCTYADHVLWLHHKIGHHFNLSYLERLLIKSWIHPWIYSNWVI